MNDAYIEFASDLFANFTELEWEQTSQDALVSAINRTFLEANIDVSFYSDDGELVLKD